MFIFILCIRYNKYFIPNDQYFTSVNPILLFNMCYVLTELLT
jgi:hypothetical protein